MGLYQLLMFTHRKPKVREQHFFSSVSERTNLMSVLASYDCHKKITQTGSLKQEQCIFSYFGQPEV